MNENQPSNIHLYPIFRYFKYDHLPEHLQKISKPFHDLAIKMINDIQDGEGGQEKAAGLRKLLEAKDCFVRAGIKPEDPLRYNNNLFYKILLANELGNDLSLALRFSDADGVNTGKSGYSFGISQFDIANNGLAIQCLEECCFSAEEIEALLTQSIPKEDLAKYDAKLAASIEIVEKYDKMNIMQSLVHTTHLISTSGISLAGPETLYHIADYHNQFHFTRDGKLHKFLLAYGSTITPDTILQFKLEYTAWGKKRPDDVKRRYNNIVQIFNA